MIVKLFDIQNGKVIPTEHCYTLKALKVVMDNYPDDYLKIYQYLFYMTCPNPDMNPFFHTPDIDKEHIILNEIGGEFSPEDDDTELEPFTQVYLKSGYSHCINIPYNDFLKIMQNVD